MQALQRVTPAITISTPPTPRQMVAHSRIGRGAVGQVLADEVLGELEDVAANAHANLAAGSSN
jgi:hypothetical protein